MSASFTSLALRADQRAIAAAEHPFPSTVVGRP